MRIREEEPPPVSEPRPEEMTAADLKRRARPYVSLKERTGRSRAEEYFSLKNSLIAMAVGGFFCWWDSLGGIGHQVLRFLSALTHEIGHAAVATVFGAPAFPAISMNGHAAAIRSEQFTMLVFGLWAFFGYMAFTMRREGKAWKFFAGATVIYPLIAFTGLWKPLWLLSGHLGELTFAGVFFWRAWTGGFTHSLQERFAYGSVAWFLAVHNMIFHFRLMTNASYQMRYHGSGSFGLVNDYIRVSDMAGVSLGTVAGGMLFVNVVVLPLVVWWWIRGISDVAPAAD